MKICGIDYSYTSPSICIWNLDNNSYDFHFCTSKKNLQTFLYQPGMFSFQGHELPSKEHDAAFYADLAEWVVYWTTTRMVDRVVLEGYSMGSQSGRNFNIGENTGILKHYMYNHHQINFEVVAPTQVKKLATGKGNANKEQLYDQWLQDTKIDLWSRLQPKASKVNNPLSDIVDSFYIAKAGEKLF